MRRACVVVLSSPLAPQDGKVVAPIPIPAQSTAAAASSAAVTGASPPVVPKAVGGKIVFGGAKPGTKAGPTLPQPPPPPPEEKPGAKPGFQAFQGRGHRAA